MLVNNDGGKDNHVNVSEINTQMTDPMLCYISYYIYFVRGCISRGLSYNEIIYIYIYNQLLKSVRMNNANICYHIYYYILTYINQTLLSYFYL